MRRLWLGLAALALFGAGPAQAQQTTPIPAAPKTTAATTSGVGQVQVITEGTPTDSVLVLRGGQVYTLGVNDTIFPGDKVFTRTNGAVRFTLQTAAGTCNIGLGGQKSFDIPLNPAASCNALGAVQSLEYTASINNVGVGVGATAGGLGATPALIGLLGGGALVASFVSN